MMVCVMGFQEGGGGMGFDGVEWGLMGLMEGSEGDGTFWGGVGGDGMMGVMEESGG